jgi:hypothetical protein
MGENGFYVRMRGKVLGPFSQAQLRTLRDRGQLRRFHELSEDRRGWFSAGDITELFPPEEVRTTASTARDVGAAAPSWYYMDASQTQNGPVAREQLTTLYRSGALDDTTLVWQSGMPDWAPLSSLGLIDSTGGRTASSREPALSTEASLGWSRVRTGLAVTLVGTFTFFATLVLFGLFVLIGSSTNSPRATAPVLVFILILSALLGFASRVLQTTGFGFCAASPPESGTRGLGVAAFSLAAVNAVFTLLLFFLWFTAGTLSTGLDWRGGLAAGHLIVAFTFLDGLVMLAKLLLHLFFLRGVAVALRRLGLAQAVTFLTIFYGVAAFLNFFVGVLYLVYPQVFFGSAMDVGAASDYAAGILVSGVLLLVLWLGWLTWYVITLFLMRGAISDHLATERRA